MCPPVFDRDFSIILLKNLCYAQVDNSQTVNTVWKQKKTVVIIVCDFSSCFYM